MIDPAAPAPVGNMGQPIPRYDVRAKVTGKALYAADMALPDVAYAYLLSSRIAKGRIKSFDLKAARALPGVLDILTYQTIGDDIRKVKFFRRVVRLRIPSFRLALPRSPTPAKRLRWCLLKPWKLLKTRPTKLASSMKSSRQPGPSIRKERSSRSWLSRTRNTMILRLGISRSLMRPRPLKSTSAIRRRRSITTRSNCSPPNASGMARS